MNANLTSAGLAVFAAVMEMATRNKLTFTRPSNHRANFANGVTFHYDPSDAFSDPGCSEFLYIYKGNKQLAEGFVMPSGEHPYCRIDSDNPDNETPLRSPDALAGFLFARLMDALKPEPEPVKQTVPQILRDAAEQMGDTLAGLEVYFPGWDFPHMTDADAGRAHALRDALVVMLSNASGEEGAPTPAVALSYVLHYIADMTEAAQENADPNGDIEPAVKRRWPRTTANSNSAPML